MKIGIVSNTQSNAQALKAVLEHMDGQGVEKKVHLGNVVGMCAEPNETIELTMTNFNFITYGNLDEDVIEKERLNWLRASQHEITEWTVLKTKKENKEYLRDLEFGFVLEEGLAFCHSNDYTDAKVLFCGSIFHSDGEIKNQYIEKMGKESISPRVPNRTGESQVTVKLEDGEKHTINVGSCGFPTDGDSRASYAIYDSEKKEVTFYKIPYNIDKAVGRMQREGFPQKIINKVLHGM